MNFNNANCHLSKPVYRPASESREKYYENRRKYFNENLKNKSVIYEGKETKLVFHDIEGDKCFNKFAKGSEACHTDKDGNLFYDRERLERLNWIFEILEKIELCEKCKFIQIRKDKTFPDRKNIVCFCNNYKIVIIIKENEKYNIIVSAYYILTNKEQNERKKRKKQKGT